MPHYQIDRYCTEAALTTTDATAATVFAYTVPSGAAGSLRASVVGISGSTVAVYGRMAGIYRPAGGSARLVGAPLDLFAALKDVGAALWGGVTFVPSGNDIQIRTAGIGSTNVSWWCFIEVDLGGAP